MNHTQRDFINAMLKAKSEFAKAWITRDAFMTTLPLLRRWAYRGGVPGAAQRRQSAAQGCVSCAPRGEATTGIKRHLRRYLQIGGMTPEQIGQLTPREIELVEIAHTACVAPNEIGHHDGKLVVNTAGPRKMCAIATIPGVAAHPERVRGLMDEIGYEEALSRQQRRRPALFRCEGGNDAHTRP